MDLSLGRKSYSPNSANIKQQPRAIRYVDEKMMGRPTVRELLIKTIELIENMRKNQRELDETYNTLISQFSKLITEPQSEQVGRCKSTPLKHTGAKN